tara:strand:+ start:44 stop:1528 length:1485 start_codon:yes stop_codon:yes gene_type:complete
MSSIFGNLKRNTLANFIQVILSTFTLFILYRYLIYEMGLEALGIWAVVLSAVSSGRLVELGLASAPAKFVSKYLALNSYSKVNKVIDTISISIFILLLIFSPLLYYFLDFIFPYFIDEKFLPLITQMIPYIIGSLVLSAVASVFQGSIDGFERMDIGAFIKVSAQLLLLILAVIFVPTMGLIGLALSQLIQGIYLLIVSRLFIKYLSEDMSILPKKFSLKTLKKIFNYGLNMQVVTIFVTIREPILKAFISKFGGLAAVGIFEVAFQIVSRLSTVIYSVNQVIVPRISALKEQSSNEIDKLFKINYEILIFIVPLIFTLVFCWSGVLSLILLGDFEHDFVYVTYVVGFGWVANVMVLPIYFYNMGYGSVQNNALSEAIVGISNIILGFLLGTYFGLYGVTIGYSISMLFGALVLIYRMAKQNINVSVLFSKIDIYFLISSLLLLGYFYNYPINFSEGFDYGNTMLFLLPLVTLLLYSIYHPMRKKIFTIVFNDK